jgi:hypothetical protein
MGRTIPSFRLASVEDDEGDEDVGIFLLLLPLQISFFPRL